MTQFSRTEILLGKEAMEKLAAARVAVFGVGGVGGYVCEALVRSGVGAFDLIDNDKVSLTNLNRQIIATHRTLGRYKVEVMRERMLEINPDVDVRVYKSFFLPENAEEFPFAEYDYIVDAVDTVTAKIELVMKAREKSVPIISSMGAGNKLNAGGFKAADIYDTKVCPLAKVMRRELKKRGVEKLKVVYSEETPVVPAKMPFADGGLMQGNGLLADGEEPSMEHETVHRKAVPGSVAFVPSAAGLVIAGEVVRDLCEAGRSGSKETAATGREKREKNVEVPREEERNGERVVIYANRLKEAVAVIREVAAWGREKGLRVWPDEWLTPEELVTEEAPPESFYIGEADGETACAFILQDRDGEFWGNVPEGEAIYLHKFCVRRSFAHRGMTRAVVEAIRQQCRDRGIKYIRLDAALDEKTIRKIYLSVGFRIVDIIDHENGRSTALYELEV